MDRDIHRLKTGASFERQSGLMGEACTEGRPACTGPGPTLAWPFRYCPQLQEEQDTPAAVFRRKGHGLRLGHGEFPVNGTRTFQLDTAQLHPRRAIWSHPFASHLPKAHLLTFGFPWFIFCHPQKSYLKQRRNEHIVRNAESVGSVGGDSPWDACMPLCVSIFCLADVFPLVFTVLVCILGAAFERYAVVTISLLAAVLVLALIYIGKPRLDCSVPVSFFLHFLLKGG